MLVALAMPMSGQNQLKEQFERDLTSYINAFNNSQWEMVTQMMYPEIFQIVSREDAIED